LSTELVRLNDSFIVIGSEELPGILETTVCRGSEVAE